MTDVDQSGRRSRLRSVKLHALVRDHLGHDVDAVPGTFPPGAALTLDGGAWVLAEDDRVFRPTSARDQQPPGPVAAEPAVFRPPDPPPWAAHGRPETRTTCWPSTVDDPRRNR